MKNLKQILAASILAFTFQAQADFDGDLMDALFNAGAQTEGAMGKTYVSVEDLSCWPVMNNGVRCTMRDTSAPGQGNILTTSDGLGWDFADIFGKSPEDTFTVKSIVCSSSNLIDIEVGEEVHCEVKY